MFSNRKNIGRLNSWAAGIFGISNWQHDNSFNKYFDLNTLILIGILLVGISIFIFSYNLMKGKREKYLTSKLNRSK